MYMYPREIFISVDTLDPYNYIDSSITFHIRPKEFLGLFPLSWTSEVGGALD